MYFIKLIKFWDFYFFFKLEYFGKELRMRENVTSTVTQIIISSPMLATFRNLWYQMFLATLLSSLLIHLFGAILLYVRLRKHRYAKYLALTIQIAGLATPLLICSVSNALIAIILVFTERFDISWFYVILIGCLQTVCVIAVEFLRIIQTL